MAKRSAGSGSQAGEAVQRSHQREFQGFALSLIEGFVPSKEARL